MKIIFYVASTPNGLIAKSDGNSDWTSPEDNTSFMKFCRKIGFVIMGRHTYELLYPRDLPEAQHLLVLSSNPQFKTGSPDIIHSLNIDDALHQAVLSGFETICVIGGSTTWTAFASRGLIDEIYFDIEPLLFSQGMPLFKPSDFEFKLKLIEYIPLSSQILQLHYQVLK